MNTRIIAVLEELREIAEMMGEVYGAKAYRAAISAVRQHPEITRDNIVALRGTPAIGTGIYNKIQELVTTGDVADLVRLRGSPIVSSYRELSRVLGAGPKTVAKWIEGGISTVTELRAASHAGTVKLNAMQCYGIVYYGDLNTRIPRAEVGAISTVVRDILVRLDRGVVYEVAGSYRRGLPTSGDIDTIVTTRGHYSADLLGRMTALLRTLPGFVAAITEGPERTTFLYRYDKGSVVRQVDVLYVPEASYYPALLYFTGDYMFNERMRGWAKGRGYRLNQTGLYKQKKDGSAGTPIPAPDERAIFAALGLLYVPPEQRDEDHVLPVPRAAGGAQAGTRRSSRPCHRKPHQSKKSARDRARH